MASRWTLALGLVVLAATLEQPTSRASGAEGTAEAFASWESDRFVTFAGAREALVAGDRSVGSVGYLGCPSARGPCIGAGVIEVLGTDAFTIDPALQQAHLEMAAAGSAVELTWNGQGLHQPGASPEEGAGVRRDADSGGTAFGAALSDPRISFLRESAAPAEPPLVVGYAAGGSRGPRYITTPTLGGSSGSGCISFTRNERRFARKIDRERAAEGRRDLRLDADLGKVARKHTREMIDANLLHHSTDRQMLDRIIGWDVLGENVGVGGTVVSLHDAFMASPPHRHNVLYRRYRRVGVGVGRGHGRMWVTIIFQDGDNPTTALRCN
jgi:hypothetical protein